MKLSKPKEIYNLDKFLPPDGEDTVEISLSSGQLDIDIFYEPLESKKEQKKTIRFRDVRHFFKSPFPGVSLANCPDDRNLELLHSLVQYEYSELLDNDPGSIESSNYKHYRIFLHSVGMAIYVVAESTEITQRNE